MSARSGRIAVLPGEELTATAWVKPDAQRAGSLYVEFWNGQSPRSRVAVLSTPVPGSATVGAWTQLSTGPLVAPDDAVDATVLLYSPLAAGSGASPAVSVWDDVALASRAPSGRKVANGDFEENREFFASSTDTTETDNAPTQWAVTAGPSTSVTVRSAAKFSGSYGLLIDDQGTGTDGTQPRSAVVVSRPVPVASGETVTATVWGRSPTSPAVGTMAVEALDASGARVGTPALHTIGGSTWQRLSDSVTGSSTIKALRIKLYTSAPNLGQAYWDAVSLRSSLDTSGTAATRYDPTVIDTGSVLSVGDLRVETYSGSITRPVQASRGTQISLADYPGFDDANPRLYGTVLCTDTPCDSLIMWYVSGGGTGYATSSDGGLTWVNQGPTHNTALGTASTVASVVRKQGDISGVPSSAAYLGLRNSNVSSQRYEFMWSDDGIDWTPVSDPASPETAVGINGWDVGNLTYDQARQRYVATVKEWQATAPRGPRTVWFSTSTDFLHWTAPTPALAADNTDYAAPALLASPTPISADIYGMPATRYGDQLLGLAWVFDMTEIPYPTGNPGPDVGPAKIELTTSANGVTWSRPVRTPVISRGSTDSDWDHGFQTTSNGFVRAPGASTVDLYYSSSKRLHAEASPEFRLGKVSWDIDRFQSWHAVAGTPGTVTTKTLDLGTGATVEINATTTAAGSIRVDLLNPDGTLRIGCEAGAVIGTNVDAKDANRATASFATGCALSGESRLRFTLDGADLFSYQVS